MGNGNGLNFSCAFRRKSTTHYASIRCWMILNQGKFVIESNYWGYWYPKNSPQHRMCHHYNHFDHTLHGMELIVIVIVSSWLLRNFRVITIGLHIYPDNDYDRAHYKKGWSWWSSSSSLGPCLSGHNSSYPLPDDICVKSNNPVKLIGFPDIHDSYADMPTASW